MPTQIFSPMIDGFVSRDGSANETFATIIGGAGTLADNTGLTISTLLQASGTSNQFARINRGILTFDTSAITSGATITAVTFSFVCQNVPGESLGTTSLVVVSAAPASNTNLVAADYSTLGSTSLGSIAAASIDTGGVNYNNISLSTSAVVKGSITGLGTKLEWDRSGAFGGVWASSQQQTYTFQSSNNAGADKDPKLTVVYTVDQTLVGNPDWSLFPKYVLRSG